MDRSAQIRERIKEIANNESYISTIMGKVQSVDKTNKIITIQDDELIYPDVRLKPVEDGSSGFTIYPSIDTWCIAIRLEDSEDFMMVNCGLVDEVEVLIGDVCYTINSNGFVLKKGGESLSKIISDILDAIALITVTCTAPGTPSSLPINAASFNALKMRLTNLLP